MTFLEFSIIACFIYACDVCIEVYEANLFALCNFLGDLWTAVKGRFEPVFDMTLTKNIFWEICVTLFAELSLMSGLHVHIFSPKGAVFTNFSHKQRWFSRILPNYVKDTFRIPTDAHDKFISQVNVDVIYIVRRRIERRIHRIGTPTTHKLTLHKNKKCFEFLAIIGIGGESRFSAAVCFGIATKIPCFTKKNRANTDNDPA